MPTSILVVTPSPSFGELIRRPLEETGSYRVHVVNSKATAIVRADEESCRMAFLDLDLGDAWVEEVGQSLRTIIPNIELYILAGDETPAAFDSIRPWTLLRKPFELVDVLKSIGGPAGKSGDTGSKETGRDLLWLSDVNKAAQHLTRLTLESSSQAALITRENQVWAYAGQLSQEAAQEIAKALSRNWDSAKGGDLLRFVRLESTKAEHMLYATQLADGMLLAMVFDAETPFSTIRTQAGQLATSLADGEGSEAQPADEEIETAPPPMAEIDDADGDEDGMEMPPIADILKDIPIPDPRGLAASSRMQAAASAPPAVAQKQVAERVAGAPEVASSFARGDEAPRNPSEGKTEQIDPDATRRSIFSHDASLPLQMKDRSGLSDETVASQVPVRPETPVRLPLPGETDETRPQAKVQLPSSELNVGSIAMEPISAGVYHLAYACLLVPRFATHFLTGDMADKLSEWMPIICVAFGWRLEYVAVRPEYLQWVANVPPNTSPGYLMRVMRQQISDKIFAAFPRLKRDNPSGDFWAPGYLIMGGTQPHPPQLVKDYIRHIRQRQGIEKPPTKTPKS